MPRIVRPSDGGAFIEADLYRLVVPPGERSRLSIEAPAGRPLVDLVLMSSAHPPAGVDELTSRSAIDVEELIDGVVQITQAATSTVWPRKLARLLCLPDRLTYTITLDGSAAIDELQLFECGHRDPRYLNQSTLSGYWRPARERDGWEASHWRAQALFTPAPNVASRSILWSGERATNHPFNDSTFLGGDWFFTPAPFCYGLGEGNRWLMLGLAPTLDELDFARFDYHGGRGWGITLTYDGYTRVAGRWTSPTLLLIPATDPYEGLAAYVRSLATMGLSPSPLGAVCDWWREPIWCGWGEQVARETSERHANQLSTRANYEEWLAALEQYGVSPGTVVIDDRWQARLGGAEPSARWPDLAGFIGEQQALGRRVLLWHNVWETEREDDRARLIRRYGEPVIGAFGHQTLDPTDPSFAARMRELMIGMLAPPPRGLGGDGLKLDITHSTPFGAGLETSGSSRGNGLLRRLLRETYQAAKDVNPEALIEGHAANPYFLDTCDMLRLNDVFTDLRSVVEQMTHRARVARSAGFELLDADGWAMPSREALLEYVEAQPDLAVPSLYYATRIDRSREPLRPQDYQRIAAAWSRYRRSL